jgi:hypothetical protein
MRGTKIPVIRVNGVTPAAILDRRTHVSYLKATRWTAERMFSYFGESYSRIGPPGDVFNMKPADTSVLPVKKGRAFSLANAERSKVKMGACRPTRRLNLKLQPMARLLLLLL